MNRPYITEEAMRWLVEDRKILSFGTDSSGFEVRGVTHYPDHRLVKQCGHSGPGMSDQLGRIAQQRFTLLPCRFLSGIGSSPVRAMGLTGG